MTSYIQVITTTDKMASAEKIASLAVEQRLAACVQISTCRSVYRWEGKIEQAEEFVCTMKSREDLYPDLEKTIRQVHPYKVPEIIVTPILQGAGSYLTWLNVELREKVSGI